MRVVITGGTGTLGHHLAQSLVERGDDVVVFSRGSTSNGVGAPRPNHCNGAGKVEVVQWRPTEPGEWQSALDGVDAVVHLAGADVMEERWSPDRKKVIEDSRIRSGALLAEGMAKAKRKPKVYVCCSGVGYYGMRSDDAICDESTGPGSDYLAEVCIKWEASAKAAVDAGVRVAFARTGVVLAADAHAFKKLIAPYRMFVGGPIGPGTQYLPWIHIVDWVRGVEFVLDGDLRGPFNVSAPEPVTQEQFADAVGHTLGRPSSFKVPVAAMKMILGADRAEVVTTGQRAVPKALSDAGFAFVFPDVQSALSDLLPS